MKSQGLVADVMGASLAADDMCVDRFARSLLLLNGPGIDANIRQSCRVVSSDQRLRRRCLSLICSEALERIAGPRHVLAACIAASGVETFA